jgi:hypothetical protein
MWILTAGQYAAAISAILALVGIIVQYGILKPIKSYIDKATYPIAPHANGGKSLPDAIAGIARIEAKMCDLDDRVARLEKKRLPKS